MHRQEARAFTLAELTIVVLIVAILAAVGLPAISESYSDISLRSSAQRLMSELSYARNLAITDGAKYGLSFSTTGYKVVKVTSANLDDEFAAITSPVTHSPWNVSFAAERITLAASFAGHAIIWFDSTGAPNTSGSVVLTRTGRSLTVSVEALTGRTTVAQ